MTANLDSERFRSGAEKYAAYLETAEGRLRLDLPFANVQECLPKTAQSLRALDLGCGTGATGVRMAALGAAWGSTTAVQVYTVHDLHPFLGTQIVARGAARHGLTWQFCRPPVIGLEYEMDCRCVATERVLPA